MNPLSRLLKPKNDGCKYCTGDHMVVASNDGGRVLVGRRSIIFEVRHDDGSYTQEGWCYSHIDFCPYCGRDLR